VNRIPSLGARGEGWVALQLAAIGLVAVAPAFDDQPTLVEPLASILRVGGQAIVLASFGLLLWGYLELRRARAFSVMPRPIAGGQLVESGPYRLIRHPIYSALILGAVGIAAQRGSWLTLLAAVGLLAVLDLKRRREEAWLAARFEAFAAYRARTKAFIPFVY
jgi:protein-S-isoprenylcysteine O-methyltransferase Ste14